LLKFLIDSIFVVMQTWVFFNGKSPLQLPVQSVHITTKVMSLNRFIARCTTYNIMQGTCICIYVHHSFS
jgi:hypothetical protein